MATDLRLEDLVAAFRGIAADGLPIGKAVQGITDRETGTRAVHDTVARHRRLDLPFYNAGGRHFASIEATTPQRWRYVNALNLDTVFFGMQAAIEVRKENGGSIINLSSRAWRASLYSRPTARRGGRAF